MSSLDVKIGFVGGGAMAQAIAEGLISSGTVPAANISASAPSSRFSNWWGERGAAFLHCNHTVVQQSDVVFIAVKPHLYKVHNACIYLQSDSEINIT